MDSKPDTGEFPPVVYVDIFKATPPRFRGKGRKQTWRWHATNANNHKILASGESYANRADALAAIYQLFGHGSSAYLRQSEIGDVALRMATK